MAFQQQKSAHPFFNWAFFNPSFMLALGEIPKKAGVLGLILLGLFSLN